MAHSRVSRPLPVFTPKAIDRFLSYRKVGRKEACWNWAGPKSVGYRGGKSHVYGIFGFKKHLIKAHRIAFFLATQQDPAPLLVCHRCDNTLCCNPDHLYCGTAADNDADSRERNRDSHGSRHPGAKLTEEQVVQLRSLRRTGRTYQSIADQFGVSLTTAYDACKGVSWRRVK